MIDGEGIWLFRWDAKLTVQRGAVQEHLRNAPNADIKPYATFGMALAAGEPRSLEIFLG